MEYKTGCGTIKSHFHCLEIFRIVPMVTTALRAMPVTNVDKFLRRQN